MPGFQENTSDESQTNISDYTNEDFITFLYKLLFKRPSDSERYINWLVNMNEGMIKEEVITNFGHNPEFETLC